ncbi:N-acetyltransferase [Sphingopyxis sp.]|uniref:GNAT family N-acetyltransferase n=1 Tax=Sphingopyxis sp. TaxID=1908224 RepID=UPI002D791076|nr:N-acetyltransferase [Sphingopyxis sp.]HET6524788.1 N-acetyltransferase [Sphingopyxis sp.]
MIVRPATQADAAAVWAILEPVIRAGETYTLDRAMSRDDALAYWFGADNEVFVAEADGAILGTSYLRANQAGGGAHVCNAGYMTGAAATGRGVARAMCMHSIERAKARGFRAMQFNFVVSSNVRAIGLWQSLGFAVVGRLPGAFAHPTESFVDALVMFRTL